jgi:hypothetical protein
MAFRAINFFPVENQRLKDVLAVSTGVFIHWHLLRSSSKSCRVAGVFGAHLRALTRPVSPLAITLCFPSFIHFAGSKQELTLVVRQTALAGTGHLFQNGVQLGF